MNKQVNLWTIILVTVLIALLVITSYFAFFGRAAPTEPVQPKFNWYEVNPNDFIGKTPDEVCMQTYNAKGALLATYNVQAAKYQTVDICRQGGASIGSEYVSSVITPADSIIAANKDCNEIGIQLIFSNGASYAFAGPAKTTALLDMLCYS